jgi:hypothetical protein
MVSAWEDLLENLTLLEERARDLGHTRQVFDADFQRYKDMMEHKLLDEFGRTLANKLSNGRGTTLERWCARWKA